MATLPFTLANLLPAGSSTGKFEAFGLLDGSVIVEWQEIANTRTNAVLMSAMGGTVEIVASSLFNPSGHRGAALADGGFVLMSNSLITLLRYDMQGLLIQERVFQTVPVSSWLQAAVAGLPFGGWVAVTRFGADGSVRDVRLFDGVAASAFAPLENGGYGLFGDQDALRAILAEQGTDRADYVTLTQAGGFDGAGGNDFLVGSRFDDVLFGGPGTDIVYGRGGNDQIDLGDNAGTGVRPEQGYGGGGNDVIRQGDGPARLFGGNGNDRIEAGAGRDFLSGGQGDDFLRGGEGDDTLEGGGGNDVLFGGEDDDQIFGGAGNDTIFGGAGDDRIFGGDLPDSIEGARVTTPSSAAADRIRSMPGRATTVSTAARAATCSRSAISGQQVRR